MKVRAARLVAALLLAVVAAASADDVGSEYRQTVYLQHPIKGDLAGFSQLEYRENPEQDYQTWLVLWPGVTYTVRNWLQLSGGLTSLYTDNGQGADTLELRPFGGVRLSAPNKIKWNIYNYTRYEFRDTENLDTHDWTSYSRVRSRFGVEFPLASRERAWHPRTWYGLADVEPIYRFDHDTIDPLYLRGGSGYVLNDRVRLEFVYWAKLSRPGGDGSLQHTDNIFQLDIRIGLGRGSSNGSVTPKRVIDSR